MPAVRDEAVVLRNYEYSENSQILVLLTLAHGRVRVIAKGIKRGTRARFAPAVDLLDAGTVNFYPRHGSGDGGLSILGEWKQTRVFPGLRSRLDRLYAALYCGEAVARVVEDFDPHPALFAAFLGTLARLETGVFSLRDVVDFLGVLLREIGLWPRLDACRNCGRGTELTYFAPGEAGALCRHCEGAFADKRPMSKEMRSLLESAFDEEDSRGGPSETVVPTRLAEGGAGATELKAGSMNAVVVSAFRLLDEYLSHVTGRASDLAPKLLLPASSNQPP